MDCGLEDLERGRPDVGTKKEEDNEKEISRIEINDLAPSPTVKKGNKINK